MAVEWGAAIPTSAVKMPVLQTMLVGPGIESIANVPLMSKGLQF